MEGLSTPLPEDNKGNLLLKKMGWEGGALGQNGSGIMEPVEIHIKRDNKGIGANSESQQPINTSMSFVLSLTNLFYEDCAMDGEMGEINKPGNTRKRRD